MSRFFRGRSVFIVLGAAWALGAGCGDDVNPGPTWLYFSLANSGLPSNDVYDLAVDDAGVWFACAGGLAYHSPGLWLVYDRGRGMPADDVFAVEGLPNGDIWAGTPEGAVRLREGVLRTFTTEEGMPSNRVVTIAFDGVYLWLGTDRGLARYDGANFRVFDADDGLPSELVRDVWAAGAGRVWVACAGGAAYIEGETVRAYTLPHTPLPSSEVTAVAAGPDGVWFGTDAGLCLWRDGAVLAVYNTGNSSLAGDVINDLGWRGDELWVATTTGASRRRGQGFETFRVGNGLPANYVLAAVGDEHRQVWLGTLGGGAARFFEPQ